MPCNARYLLDVKPESTIYIWGLYWHFHYLQKCKKKNSDSLRKENEKFGNLKIPNFNGR